MERRLASAPRSASHRVLPIPEGATLDANQFDSLTKRLAPASTRRATLGALAGAGLLSSLGLARTAPEARAAQATTCLLAFVAAVRLGPSAGVVLTTNGTVPGELRGELSFSLSATGKLEGAILRLPNGTNVSVVGQATGHALQLRIELGQRLALVAVGVGEQEVAACRGAIDGVATGPEVGDLGDWHAAVLQQPDGTGGGVSPTTSTTAPGGPTGPAPSTAPSGPSGSTGTRGPSGPTTPSPTGTTGSSSTTGPTTELGNCPDGQTRCAGMCVDLSSDDDNCGACGNVCGPVSPQNPGVYSYCQNGVCVAPECPAGTTDCANYCADLTTSPVHCGACGHACAAGENCVNGMCQPPPVCAQPGQPCGAGGCCVGYCGQDETCECVSDGSACAPVGTGGCCSGQPCNPDGYCGTCGTLGAPCNADAECCQGNYAALCCFDGVRLTTVCTDVTNIGFVCPGEPTGPVTCAAGLTDCGGECVDLTSNAGNCGACGVSCSLGGVCIGGSCGAPAPTCLVNGSPCTYGVDVCCAGLTCYQSICQCSPPGDVCVDPTVCCSGVCNGDGFCD